MKPSHKKPYYYIVNENSSITNVTNKEMDDEILKGSYQEDIVGVTDYRFAAMKEKGDRTSNQSTVNLEIHSGTSEWELKKVYLTYIKSPMYVSMSLEEIMEIDDNSQVLEFPDYICYEIINIYVRLLLENASDPRLQTNTVVNQSIGVPQQQNNNSK